MDFLKAELERKKRQIKENSDIVAPNKKYFKRGDLAAKQEEAYWSKHKRHISVDSEEAVEDSKTEQKTDEKTQEQVMLHRKEVIRRLREINEPILLFGESEYDAFVRLKKLESMEPDFSKGMGAGSNDFKAAMDRVDQEYMEEIMKSADGEGSAGGKQIVSVKDDGTTLEDIEKWKQELGKGDSNKDQEIILRYLKFVLKTWGNDINHVKTESEKRSFKGKLNAAMHQQTVVYMKPMFRKLKTKSMQADILECLVQIIGHQLDRHYIKANDAYLEMAIGNAPWPIGVTMVGIHARTGREKISSRYVAHVLNDETQRKYIQGLKRIMTQAQIFFPTDPSRSVNFEPIHH
ncbi:PRP18-like protein [Mya arenaria]|uniref:Pre-mRNA-splicing factor 18 n=1 Tax=Mya arenaria TaxID=6604 RepID=A0ABY7FUU9_MYAAR|nr:pre-mRNA-splicing factor 18-like [Mya arenaria]WAR26013.1 PRP18-like protein [Mya arenaria]